jgi:predicted NUDIX family NTP pyrophosphohydrolase
MGGEMPKLSAGLLLYRKQPDVTIEVFLVHPGGPFWAKKDDGAWSIAKGEYENGEDPWTTALREFEEEVGLPPPGGTRINLGEVKQPSGKRVTCFAVEGDLASAERRSNSFEMEWPRGSGRIATFPEVDRADWFPVAVARKKLIKGQVPFLDRLMEIVADDRGFTLSE